jgi:hypothetical protein
MMPLRTTTATVTAKTATTATRPDNDHEPWVTARVVAVHFSFSERWVRRSSNRKEHPMPCRRLRGSGGQRVRYRYRISEVEQWWAEEQARERQQPGTAVGTAEMQRRIDKAVRSVRGGGE